MPLRPPDAEVRLPIIQRQLTDKSRERKQLCADELTPETPRRYAEMSARIDRLLDELAEALHERGRERRRPQSSTALRAQGATI